MFWWFCVLGKKWYVLDTSSDVDVEVVVDRSIETMRNTVRPSQQKDFGGIQ